MRIVATGLPLEVTMSVLSKLFHPVESLHTTFTEETSETVFVDSAGGITQKESIRFGVVHQHLPNDEQIEMVIIPVGSFSMGSHPPVGYEDERPAHYVHVARFLLSRYTVTQEQWKAVMGKTPPCRGKAPGSPVDRVSWSEAQRFCQRLSVISGNPYRLPSEAEWEYACRASSSSAFSHGNMITTDFSNYVGLHAYAGGPIGEYRHGPIPAGRFPPNRFGLHDMHGNLWEWCEDTWHADYAGAPSGGEAWIHGGTDERVLRGGSWHDPPDLCRSGCRLKLKPTEGEDFVGVRIAMADGPWCE
jgi:formylglycine-generating enzyme required for sulfatase activity